MMHQCSTSEILATATLVHEGTWNIKAPCYLWSSILTESVQVMFLVLFKSTNGWSVSSESAALKCYTHRLHQLNQIPDWLIGWGLQHYCLLVRGRGGGTRCYFDMGVRTNLYIYTCISNRTFVALLWTSCWKTWTYWWNPFKGYGWWEIAHFSELALIFNKWKW